MSTRPDRRIVIVAAITSKNVFHDFADIELAIHLPLPISVKCDTEIKDKLWQNNVLLLCIVLMMKLDQNSV